jgi:hypothetical protein
VPSDCGPSNRAAADGTDATNNATAQPRTPPQKTLLIVAPTTLRLALASSIEAAYQSLIDRGAPTHRLTRCPLGRCPESSTGVLRHSKLPTFDYEAAWRHLQARAVVALNALREEVEAIE